MTYNVEVSGDPQTWSSGPSFTVTITNIPSQLIVRDNTPVGSALMRFIHLRISDPYDVLSFFLAADGAGRTLSQSVWRTRWIHPKRAIPVRRADGRNH